MLAGRRQGAASFEAAGPPLREACLYIRLLGWRDWAQHVRSELPRTPECII